MLNSIAILYELFIYVSAEKMSKEIFTCHKKSALSLNLINKFECRKYSKTYLIGSI